jgi:hypothetical protein
MMGEIRKKCMIKKALVFLYSLLCFCVTYAQTGQFDEAADPGLRHAAGWQQAAPGLHASFASPFIKFSMSDAPAVKESLYWNVKAWKGERVYRQVIVWSVAAAGEISFSFSDFSAGPNKTLPAGIATAQFERYVLTDEFGAGCDTRSDSSYRVSLVPDMIDTCSSMLVKGKSARPVWITVAVPPNAAAGTYFSSLTLYADKKSVKKFNIQLQVLNRQLPAAADWKFYLDLWQNPYAVARYHQLTAWSQKHWEMLRPLMKMLAAAGQKTITTTINKRPWGTQTEDPYESMIVWTKKADGSWLYDYTIFDNWVQFMMDMGVKQQINCYSLVPWGNTFYFYEEGGQVEQKIVAIPGSEAYKSILEPFLIDFKNHLENKGWYTITRLAMDERGPAEMKATLSMINGVTPGFPVGLADDHKSYKLYPDQLKDLSVSFGSIIDETDLKYRKNNGMISTFYVCCTNVFPGLFTFSSPEEAVYLGWYSTALQFDGFLHWSFNNWVKAPLTDSRFRTWPAGDTYLVYPDARSSIRFELLRDGIEDAEKINILRKEYSEQHKLIKMQQLDKVIAAFSAIKKPMALQKMIVQAQAFLNSQ